MTPGQWDINSPSPKLMGYSIASLPEPTEQDIFQHIVACFHFFLQKPGVVQQKYTCAELAAAIEARYSQDNPKVVWALAFLRERADMLLTVMVSYR